HDLVGPHRLVFGLHRRVGRWNDDADPLAISQGVRHGGVSQNCVIDHSETTWSWRAIVPSAEVPDWIGAMFVPTELDSSKVVDVDLGSPQFKQNARVSLAEWAKRPPFYVLSNGPPQVICGRYADVHEVFSDPVRFSSEVPRTRHGYE